jgi:hypothetical protein
MTTKIYWVVKGFVNVGPLKGVLSEFRSSGAVGWGNAPQDERFRVSISGMGLGNFKLNCSFCPQSVALGSNQPLTEMSSKGFPWKYISQICRPGWAKCHAKNESPKFHPHPTNLYDLLRESLNFYLYFQMMVKFSTKYPRLKPLSVCKFHEERSYMNVNDFTCRRVSFSLQYFVSNEYLRKVWLLC